MGNKWVNLIHLFIITLTHLFYTFSVQFFHYLIIYKGENRKHTFITLTFLFWTKFCHITLRTGQGSIIKISFQTHLRNSNLKIEMCNQSTMIQ